MNSKEFLLYWIQERESIRKKKEAGEPKPWSADPVFQRTYFCNVRREDDKVSKFIRNFHRPWAGDQLFLLNTVFGRFINLPATLGTVGYLREFDPLGLEEILNSISAKGKLWGNAYIVTTHGLKMGKVRYLISNVLRTVYERHDALDAIARPRTGHPTCEALHKALMQCEGIGSFMSAQVIADLKNTKGHPMEHAIDKWSFVAPGPGSIRGVNWFHTNNPSNNVGNWYREFEEVRNYVDQNWPANTERIDNQDLQNCLCEYDKYMRVSTGSGRSKRSYHGT